jgi:hypothetical protein
MINRIADTIADTFFLVNKSHWLPKRLYHRTTWDLSGVASVEDRKLLQLALDACDFDFSKIRRNTGSKVPVTIADLSRYAQLMDPATGHAHVHDEFGNEGHLLGDIAREDRDTLSGAHHYAFTETHDHGDKQRLVKARAAALGLYWLPTNKNKAGSVQLDSSITTNVPLTHEVFLAEGAHAVDYGAVTDEQRAKIMALFDWKGTGDPAQGWFEEQGEEVYWRWRGERWMGLFMSAYAPSLPRPLEIQQPWQWTYSPEDVAAVRSILGALKS